MYILCVLMSLLFYYYTSPPVLLQFPPPCLHLAPDHAVCPHCLPDCRSPALHVLVPVPEHVGVPHIQQLHLLRLVLQQTALQADSLDNNMTTDASSSNFKQFVMQYIVIDTSFFKLISHGPTSTSTCTSIYKYTVYILPQHKWLNTPLVVLLLLLLLFQLLWLICSFSFRMLFLWSGGSIWIWSSLRLRTCMIRAACVCE